MSLVRLLTAVATGAVSVVGVDLLATKIRELQESFVVARDAVMFVTAPLVWICRCNWGSVVTEIVESVVGVDLFTTQVGLSLN